MNCGDTGEGGVAASVSPRSTEAAHFMSEMLWAWSVNTLFTLRSDMTLEVFRQEPNGDAQNCNGASIPASGLFFSMSGCVRLRVCPLFQCRPDKSLSLAVGLGPVWPGPLVPDTELTASFTKFAGRVTSSIIRAYRMRKG